jgi:hypothetical protein
MFAAASAAFSVVALAPDNSGHQPDTFPLADAPARSGATLVHSLQPNRQVARLYQRTD